MAGNIKGITIEFRGDTTKLDKALREVRNSSKGIDKELQQVNRALKFNPKNVELLAQKQELLKQKVTQTEGALKDLRNMQKQMDADPSVDKNSEEYRTLQREIITTESKLKHFNAELKETGMQASKIHQVGVAFEETGAKIEGVGRAMAPISRAAGAVSLALGGVTYKAGQMADDLNTLSKVTGVSTYDLQMYAATADLVDVSVEAMAKSHQKLKKSMLSASEGGETLKYFEQLGISVTDSNGELRDANDVFEETIKALGEMENETERDAIAMAIFGKSAGELNPLIEDAGATYERVSQLMEKYGLEPLSQEQLDMANEFNDAIDTIKLVFMQAVQIIGTKIAGYLVPIMEKVVKKVANFAKKFSGMSGETLTKIMAVLGAIALISPALVIVGKAIKTVGNAIQTATKIVGGLSKAISFLAANPIVLIIAGIAALVAAFVVLWNKSEAFRNFFINLWNGIRNTVTVIWNGITSVFTGAWSRIQAVWNGVSAFFSQKWQQIKNVFAGVAGWFGSIFANAWSAIKSKFSSWSSFWSGLWSSVKNKFSSIGSAVGSAISGAVRRGVNAVIGKVESVINGAISLINGAIALADKIVPGKLGRVKKVYLPRMAKGGVLNGAQTVIAGEAGPEAIIPLDRLFAQLDKMYGAMGGGGDQIVINVTTLPGQSNKQIAEEIERILTAKQKQRVKAWA